MYRRASLTEAINTYPAKNRPAVPSKFRSTLSVFIVYSPPIPLAGFDDIGSGCAKVSRIDHSPPLSATWPARVLIGTAGTHLDVNNSLDENGRSSTKGRGLDSGTRRQVYQPIWPIRLRIIAL